MNCRLPRVLSICFTALLLAQNCCLAAGAVEAPELAARAKHADMFEPFNKPAVTQRVCHLEHVIFGQIQSGDLRARIDRLDEALNSSSDLKNSREESIYKHALGLSIRLGDQKGATHTQFLIETKINPSTIYCYNRYFQRCSEKLSSELEKISIPDNQNSETPKLELSMNIAGNGCITNLRTDSSDIEIAPETVEAIINAVKRAAPFEQLPDFQQQPLPVIITVLPELRNVSFKLSDHKICRIVPLDGRDVSNGKLVECVADVLSKETPIALDCTAPLGTICREVEKLRKSSRTLNLKLPKEPTISFRLLKSGQICDCRISRSSGSAGVDAASIEVIEKCSNLVQLPITSPPFIAVDATLLARPLNGSSVMLSLDDSLTPIVSSFLGTSLTAACLVADYRTSFAAADYEKARSELETAYFIDPPCAEGSLADYYQWLALSGYRKGADALRLLYKAALLGPEWDAPQDAVFPRDWAKPRRAIADVMRSQGADPLSVVERVKYGNECLLANDTDGAILQFKEALELKKDSKIYTKLGQIFEKRKNDFKALDAYSRAYDIDKPADLLYPLANLFFKIGDAKAGFKYLIQALELQPTHAGLRRILDLHGVTYTVAENSPLRLSKYMDSVSRRLLEIIGKHSSVPVLKDSAIVNFSIDATGKIRDRVTLEKSSGVSSYDKRLMISLGTSKIRFRPLKEAGLKELNVSYRFPELTLVDRNGAPRFDSLLEHGSTVRLEGH